MDTFTDNIIKIEPNTIEEEFITLTAPPPTNDHRTLVAVKNEPISDDDFLNIITPLQATVCNEIVDTTNNCSPLTNSFVINELEPRDVSNFYLQDNNKIQNVPIITPKSYTAPPPRLLNANKKCNTTKRHPTPPRRMDVSAEPLEKRRLFTLLKEALPSTSTIARPVLLNPKVKAITNKILNTRQNDKSPQSGSTLVTKEITTKLPVLLNNQLRKRFRAIGSTKTETNLSNKNDFYAVEGLLHHGGNSKPFETTKKLPVKKVYVEKSAETCSGKAVKSDLKNCNNTKEKIINYIMRKKRVERLKKIQLNQRNTRGELSDSVLSSSINNSVTSSPSLKINIENPQDIIVKTEHLDDDANKTTIIQSSIPKEILINTSPSHTFESITTIKEESVEPNILHQHNTIQMPSLNTHLSTPFLAAPITSSESIIKTVNSEALMAFSKPHSEIKVKCLCRLTGDNTSDDQPSTSEKDLKDFFHKMFQQTRRLNKQQQRTVKMSLLQAICEAEEMVEKGKCCCF